MRAEYRFSPLAMAWLTLAGIGAAALLTGCGTGSGRHDVSLAALRGGVHGGQQPVSGASIQLYAAGASGYGSAATALLATEVTSGAGGSFTITGDYSCPSASSQVYLVASGGNPGLSAGTNNPALALMAALGPCGNLHPSTFVNIDEVTTVASVYALQQFMTAGGGANLGASSGNAQGLADAFATVNNLVDTANGTAPGPALPPFTTAPTSELNTLADLLATCVNSSGSTGECNSLFSDAMPSGGTAPTNTIDAILDIAQNPGNNVSALYNLINGTPPFQPTLGSAPNDWTVDISYTGGGIVEPVSLAIDGFGNIWLGNPANQSLSKFSPTGKALSPTAGFTGGGLFGAPFTIAIDGSGNVWTAGEGSNRLSEFSNSGAAISSSAGYTGGGLDTPTGIAIDGSGNIWIPNYSGPSLSEFSSNGTAISGSSGYTGGGLNTPVDVAVDSSGNLWVLNYPDIGFGNSLSKFSNGGAAISGSSGYTGGGISSPNRIALDGLGNIWIANEENTLSEFSMSGLALSPSSGYTGGGLSGPRFLVIDGAGHVWLSNRAGVSEFANDGTPISPSTGYTGAGISGPAGIAVDGSGNVWVANEFNNSTLTEIVGAAAPLVTPLATAVKNNQLGQRP